MKILMPAEGRRGSSIIAVDGKLKVFDPPSRTCMGYSVGCVCPKCSEREARCKRKQNHLDALPVPRCACDRPLIGDAHQCQKCGRPKRLIAA